MTKTGFTSVCAAALMLCVSAASAQDAPSAPTSAGLVQAAEGRLPAFFSCLRDQDIAVVVAHRGGPRAEFPENAIATMQRTTSMAPVFVETDVQASRDGVLFMNHDPVLDRNTTGRGAIADHDWAEIQGLKQRDPTAQPSPYAPPRLADVLEWSEGRTVLLLDVKPSTNVAKVVAEVEAAGAQGRVMYLAYTVDQAQQTLEEAPMAMVAVPMLNRDYFERMKAAGLIGRHILAMVNVNSADPDLVREIAATGSIVISGSYAGADTPDALYETTAQAGLYQVMIGQGAQAIASNRPLAAAEALMSNPQYARRLATCGIAN